MTNHTTGTTTEALRELPDGGVYVVKTYPQMRYCKSILHDVLHRDPHGIQFILLEEADRRLQAHKGPVSVDHFCFQEPLNHAQMRALDWLREMRGRLEMQGCRP